MLPYVWVESDLAYMTVPDLYFWDEVVVLGEADSIQRYAGAIR
jgi:hypothetical protein